MGPRGSDLGALSHRPAGRHNNCGGRTWGPGPKRTSTSMGFAQKSQSLLPPAQGETRGEREKERENEEVQKERSQGQERRQIRGQHRRPDSLLHRKSKYTSGPAQWI